VRLARACERDARPLEGRCRARPGGNTTNFDNAIRRFDPSRASQKLAQLEAWQTMEIVGTLKFKLNWHFRQELKIAHLAA
jgi:hypothetical protein